MEGEGWSGGAEEERRSACGPFSVPLAILGALGLQVLRGFANDVFCQVMLVGLASAYWRAAPSLDQLAERLDLTAAVDHSKQKVEAVISHA